jgi:hypothetical protein
VEADRARCDDKWSTEESKKGECEVKQVAATLGVPFIGSDDEPRGRAAFNGGGFEFLKGRKDG